MPPIASVTCCNAIKAILKKDPDREFTTDQMRKRLYKEFKMIYAHSTVSVALKRVHTDGDAERIRDGNKPFRYSLANSN